MLNIGPDEMSIAQSYICEGRTLHSKLLASSFHIDI